MIKYSVCIATYKRQELLKKLIDSILNQKNIDLAEVELIIVDNDAEGSARNIVESYLGKVACSIYYEIQPKKNISITRNTAVKKAVGKYLFFIDDDEYADENWMNTHINNLEKYNADGAFGLSIPYFHEKTQQWKKNLPNYHKDCSPSGEPPSLMSTCNCISKRQVFEEFDEPFDPDYGITGGEDNDFFSRARIKGFKFISSIESITYEFIPEERTKNKWLIQRVFRTGNNFTKTHIVKDGKQSLLLIIMEFFKGIFQAIIAFFLSVFFIWNKTKSFYWFLKAVSNIAKPFAVLGIHLKEYKE